MPESSPALTAEISLAQLRDSIDNLDACLIHVLSERFKLTRSVGELKAHHGLPAGDPAREQRQIARLRTLAADAKLDPAIAEAFLSLLIEHVVRHHELIAAERSDRPDPSSN